MLCNIHIFAAQKQLTLVCIGYISTSKCKWQNYGYDVQRESGMTLMRTRGTRLIDYRSPINHRGSRGSWWSQGSWVLQASILESIQVCSGFLPLLDPLSRLSDYVHCLEDVEACWRRRGRRGYDADGSSSQPFEPSQPQPSSLDLFLIYQHMSSKVPNLLYLLYPSTPISRPFSNNFHSSSQIDGLPLVGNPIPT